MEDGKKKELWRMIKFTLFSASAGIIEAGSIFLLESLTPLPSWACYLIGLVLSVLWNFTLNRKFTFRSAANVPRAMLLVAAYYAVFTPATTILGNWLAEDLGWNEYLVTGINMLLNVTTEFLFQKHVVYRHNLAESSGRRGLRVVHLNQFNRASGGVSLAEGFNRFLTRILHRWSPPLRFRPALPL